jgi:GNAT superfamily N-acetyltransferase
VTAGLDGVRVTALDAAAQADAASVDDGLGRANEAAAPLHDVQALASMAHLPTGELIGGAIGRTWGTCCELQQMWVREDWRRHGIGARLVAAFEQRALARGCTTFYLETFSFQAPTFYASLGYEVKLALSGFTDGIVKYTMVRNVAPGQQPPGK